MVRFTVAILLKTEVEELDEYRLFLDTFDVDGYEVALATAYEKAHEKNRGYIAIMDLITAPNHIVVDGKLVDKKECE